MGNTVRKPWMTSAAKSRGILRRDSSIATFWVSRAAWAPTPLNSAPIRPALISASRTSALRILTSGFMSPTGGRIMSAKHDSCPAFSSIVIWANSPSTRSEARAKARGVVTASPVRAAAPDRKARRLGPEGPPFIVFKVMESPGDALRGRQNCR